MPDLIRCAKTGSDSVRQWNVLAKKNVGSRTGRGPAAGGEDFSCQRSLWRLILLKVLPTKNAFLWQLNCLNFCEGMCDTEKHLFFKGMNTEKNNQESGAPVARRI
ncbi:MAG: hypothetical protein WBH78_01875 [Bacteroidales bacterium]